MKVITRGLTKWAVLLTVLLMAPYVLANSATRYLHIKITNSTNHELVRVNLPLMLAEKVIPAINDEKLRDGKVQIGNFSGDKVNVRAILDALKSAPEGEFITVQETGSDVRVAKEHGQIIVHVVDKNSDERVDVTIPWEVAEALVSDTNQNQLNVEAAIKALNGVRDTTLVRVTGRELVRVWIDSRSSDESPEGVGQKGLE
ncbi:MAG: hypothetical protein JO356_06045 [Acidobacteria bacterium]|nr:hypothetical protein [Acidobacteriota bacterium]